jgi:quinol monooxygenase YgiN
MADVAMIVRGTAQPGKRDEVFKLFERHLAPRADENDEQPVVAWCVDEADSDRFALIETYATRDAMERNAQAPWFGEYMGAVGPLLAAEPEVISLTPRWSKGL